MKSWKLCVHSSVPVYICTSAWSILLSWSCWGASCSLLQLPSDALGCWGQRWLVYTALQSGVHNPWWLCLGQTYRWRLLHWLGFGASQLPPLRWIVVSCYHFLAWILPALLHPVAGPEWFWPMQLLPSSWFCICSWGCSPLLLYLGVPAVPSCLDPAWALHHPEWLQCALWMAATHIVWLEWLGQPCLWGLACNRPRELTCQYALVSHRTGRLWLISVICDS